MAKVGRRETGSLAGFFTAAVDKKRLLADLSEAGCLYDAGEYQKAKQVFARAAFVARRAGITSGTILYGLAICHDRLMEMEDAVENILAALASDPFDAAYVNSYNIIAERLRHAVAFAGEQEKAEVERYYALLLRIGEADVAAHLVAARHYLSTARPSEAVRILDALTVLVPSCTEAWSLLADAAAAAGDGASAVRARVEAVCCHGGEAVPTSGNFKRAQA